jgi:hypothetical protein
MFETREGFNPTAGSASLARKDCYASLAKTMAYRVVAFTMMQVRQGALEFQRQLGGALREFPAIKVYSVSPFDLDERRRFRDRFGGDIVYFFNDAGYEAALNFGLDLNFLGEVAEEELPRRRTLVVGTPERTGGAAQKQS